MSYQGAYNIDEKIARDMRAIGVCEYTLSHITVETTTAAATKQVSAHNEFLFLANIFADNVSAVRGSTEIKISAAGEGAFNIGLSLFGIPDSPTPINFNPADVTTTQAVFRGQFESDFPGWGYEGPTYADGVWTLILTEPTGEEGGYTGEQFDIVTYSGVLAITNPEISGGNPAFSGQPAITIEADNEYYQNDFSDKNGKNRQLHYQRGYNGTVQVTISRGYTVLEFVRVTPAHRAPCCCNIHHQHHQK